MISTVKSNELKKSFHECALNLDAVRALEKAREAANRPRQRALQLENGMGAEWLPGANPRLAFEHGVASRLLQRAVTRRPRAPIEDEPEREAL